MDKYKALIIRNIYLNLPRCLLRAVVMNIIKKVLLVFLLFLGLIVKAQELRVIDFHPDYSLVDAVRFPKEDFNGDRCGLIKLGLVIPNVIFEGDIISSEYKDGEGWIYMAKGSNWLTIKSKTHVPLRYEFDGIESNVTYVMTVLGENTDIEEYQYLVFQITPTTATLEVDGEIWPVSWEGTARKRVELGSHTYQVRALNYQSIMDTVVLSDPDSIKTVNVQLKHNASGRKTKVQIVKKQTFITANVAYAIVPQPSFGFSVGHVKHFGWYVSVMTNGNFSGFNYSGDCDENGYTSAGYLLAYSGEVSKMRLSVMGGGVIHLGGPVYARLGAGYGNRTLRWKTESGKWVRNTTFSTAGIDLSAGLQFHIEGFVVSAEVVTTSFQTLEAKIGLGYAF